MDSNFFVSDRPGKRDFLLAALAGLVFCGIYLVFSARGLDPSLWSDMAVAADLRPPQTIFPSAWRAFAKGLLAIAGVGRIVSSLRVAGAVAGGFCVFLFYLVVRQILAYLSRVRDLTDWNWIAPLFALLSTVAFGACDSMWRIVSPITPGTLRFVVTLLVLHIFLSWLRKSGVWRILVVMFLCGAVAAESPFGFVLPLFCYVAYRLAMTAVVDGQVHAEGDVGQLLSLPSWRMFFAFVFGLFALVVVNVWTFVWFGGLEASGWNAFDILFHYAMGYWGALRGAASPVGWVLGITFTVLPLVASLVLFPIFCRESEPIRFRLGLILLFSGILALLQCGFVPCTRLWSFSTGAVEVVSDYLECLFSLCSVVTMALAASCFALGCQNRFDYDADDGAFRPVEPRGFAMRNLVQAIVILCLVPVVLRIYRPAETEMRAIVHDAVVETIRECGDAKFVFTDGRLDPGIELIAAQMGSGVKPLNMMGGPSSWERYIRGRYFEEGSPDRESAEMGVPILLRSWAGERVNGMDESAVQLGFEFWKRARKPLPKQSGFVAREKGLDDAEAERGIAVANKLAERIIALAKDHPNLAVSPALKSAVSAVSWRISRFARMRDDDTLANRLDEWNEAVKHMMRLIEYERMRTFMQLTPYEGLRLALRRADFNEARRYGATVLQIDPDDPEANFGTGMAYMMEDKLKEAEFYLERTLKKRPEEPAVLNNLSIIYRKTNRLEKALEYVRKAHELMPGNEEIKKTLRDTERAVENRKETLKEAFAK